jgi:hypothetical protein
LRNRPASTGHPALYRAQGTPAFGCRFFITQPFDPDQHQSFTLTTGKLFDGLHGIGQQQSVILCRRNYQNTFGQIRIPVRAPFPATQRGIKTVAQDHADPGAQIGVLDIRGPRGPTAHDRFLRQVFGQGVLAAKAKGKAAQQGGPAM